MYGVAHRTYQQDSEIIDLWFTVKNWQGTPQIAEPNKCSELVWVDKNNLPDDVADIVRNALKSSGMGMIDTHMTDRVS